MAIVGTLNFPTFAPQPSALGEPVGSSEATFQQVDRFVPSQTEDLSFFQLRTPACLLPKAAEARLADFGLDRPERNPETGTDCWSGNAFGWARGALDKAGLDIPELDSPNSLQAYRKLQKQGKLLFGSPPPGALVFSPKENGCYRLGFANPDGKTFRSAVPASQNQRGIGDRPLQGEVAWMMPSSPKDIHTPSQAAPPLQRPVLLIHGFSSGPETWKTMRTWLTSTSANGDGGVVDSNSLAVDPQAKVFLIKFSRPYNSIRTNAAELRQVIDKICSATGSPEIDLVGHSMGGLDARYYLQQGEEKVKNLVMIATPNHGSALSDSELKFRERGLPLMPRVDDEEVRQCQRDLCEDKVKDGKQNNPTLYDLNKDWDTQTARANMLLIAGNGRPTLQSRNALTVWGDGAVTQNSVKMDKVPLKNIWRADHKGVKEHPEALMATAHFLTGRPVQSFT